MTDRPATARSLSLSRHDGRASSEQFSEPFFRRIAELAMSALDVPVVAIKFAAPGTLWVAAQDEEQGGAALSARLQESTLFDRIVRSGEEAIEDVWAEDRFAALVDLERFAFRFVACVPLMTGKGELVGRLCVLDRRARSLRAHHRDVLRTLAEMAQSEVERQQEAARRRRGDALRNRLQRVLQMIARDEPIEVTLEALMYLVETQLPGFAATMHWLDPKELLRPVAAPSVPRALVEATDGLPADAEAGSIGAAVHDGEEVLDNDAAAGIHWPDVRAAVEAAGFAASWSFPVRSDEGRAVLGAVTLFSETPLTPTDEMRQTVEIAAQIAAVALERDHDRSLIEQMQVRHRHFLDRCSEGFYRVELDPPVPVDRPVEVQIKRVFERAHVAECNDAFARQHGFARADELIGRPLLDLYGEGQDLAQLPILRAVDHGYTLEGAESCEVDQQGRERWFRNSLQGVIEDGLLVAFWGAQREITKEQHAEYALREAEHRYRMLADLVPNPVLLHDEDDIHFVNPAAVRLLGLAGTENEPLPVTDFLGKDVLERLHRRAHDPKTVREPVYHKGRITDRDGTTSAVEMASCRVLHRGKPALLTVVREAAREQDGERLLAAGRQPEGGRSRADADRRFHSAFMADVNHEIRTPLTALIGFAEILGDEMADPENGEVRELVDHIRSNGQRLLWTLDSMLNLSRVEAGTFELRPQPLDVVREVENLVDTFQVMAREKDVALVLSADQPSVHATLDRGAFERVVGNLIAHAIRTTDDGSIALSVHATDRGPEIVVEDSNCNRALEDEGAPVEDDEDGSGARIGMAVVRSLLTLMGGELDVAARPEGGVAYTVRFDSADEVALRQAMRLLPEAAASAA